MGCACGLWIFWEDFATTFWKSTRVNLFILFLLLFSFLCMSFFFSHFRSATWFDTFCFLLMHFLLLVFGSTCWTVHRSRNHSSKLHSTCTLLTWCSGQTILYSANFYSVVCIRVSIVNVIAPWERSIGIGEVLFIPVSVARRDLVRHPALASPYISIGQLMEIVRSKFLFS